MRTEKNQIAGNISPIADYSCDKYHKSIEECKMSDDYVILWSAKRFKAYYEDHIIIDDEYAEENEYQESTELVS